MAFETKPAQEAYRYHGDSPVFGIKRSPDNRRDFGDPQTVGLSLRRVGLSFDNPDYKMNESFGVFLGEHDEGWVVATKMFDYSGLSGCEIFKTLESLKRRWELD